MKRMGTGTAGLAAYALGMASFVLFAGFLINLPAGIGIDAPKSSGLATALLIDLGLLLLFAAQHSIMARPSFKRWWTTIVPESLERSVYVLFSALALSALVIFWQPLGGTIWDLRQTTIGVSLYVIYALGWIGLVVTTFYIDHFDLFGLRQVFLKLKGRPYTHLSFKVPGPYKFIRHPIYLGWFTIVWATPLMTVSHLIVAAGLTAYIIFAVRYEERDLIDTFGELYTMYREEVPRFIPVALRRTFGSAEELNSVSVSHVG